MITSIERIQRLKLSCALNDYGKERYFHHGHEYVEIGGLKWATMNIGAQKVTDGGLYFQWGDTKGYTAEQVKNKEKCFNPKSYKFKRFKDDLIYTKYNSSDGKTVLDIEDDAVRANWGGGWRMPTTEELQALGAAVNVAWKTDYQSSGVNGMLCTAKDGSGAQLFFPAVGLCTLGGVYCTSSFGYYWNSSLRAGDVFHSRGLTFFNGGTNWNDYSSRFIGRIVRGVIG